VSFKALAAKGGELGSRAEKLLARVEWPGKPGLAAAAAPLTPEQQQRFTAGQEVYRNVCQACHQPDGRGMEKIAPPLVGSAVGQIFTDEQIAAVLTYVRREWGQTGAPVDPAAVNAVRAATKGRSRPWTETELSALLPKEGRVP
jgi:mono/diheme cytochrome c family protein